MGHPELRGHPGVQGKLRAPLLMLQGRAVALGRNKRSLVNPPHPQGHFWFKAVPVFPEFRFHPNMFVFT